MGYLFREWSQEVVDSFIERIEQGLVQLSSNPNICRMSFFEM